MKQCGPLRLRRLRGLVASAMKDGSRPANTVRRGLLWLESDLPPDPQVLAAAAAAASSLLDFDLAARLSRAADEAGVGVEARVHLAYNLLMSQKGDDAAAVIDSIATDEVSESAFINDDVLRAANLLWTMRDPEQSWRVIDEALETATGPRVGQLLAFRANQLVLAARPAEVIEMMDTVDYGTLDGYGESVRLCAETLALGEVGRIGRGRREGRRVLPGDRLVASRAASSAEPSSSSTRSGLRSPGASARRVASPSATDTDCATKPSTAEAMAAAISGMAALAAGDLRSPRSASCLPRPQPRTPTSCLSTASTASTCSARQALARLGDIAAAEEALRVAEAYRHPAYVLVELERAAGQGMAGRGASTLVRGASIRPKRQPTFAREHGQLAREVQCLQTLVQFGDTSVADAARRAGRRRRGAESPVGGALRQRARQPTTRSKLSTVVSGFRGDGRSPGRSRRRGTGRDVAPAGGTRRQRDDGGRASGRTRRRPAGPPARPSRRRAARAAVHSARARDRGAGGAGV